MIPRGGKADVSEKTLEFADFLDKKFPHFVNKTRNLEPCCRSVLDDYIRQEIVFHLHFAFDDSVGSGFCVELRCDRGINNGEFRSISQPNNFQIIRRDCDLDSSRQDATMFIDVCEFMQYPEEVCVTLIPTVVRLHSLDDAHSRVVYSSKSSPLQFCPKRVDGVTYWKSVGIRRSIFIGDHKFPYQVIEGRTKISNDISN